MNIRQKLRVWADHCIDYDQETGFARTSPLHGVQKEGGKRTFKIFGSATPRAIDAAGLDRVKAVREMDRAIPELKEKNQRLFNAVIVLLFGPCKNHKDRGKSLGYSESGYTKQILKAYRKLDEIVNSTNNPIIDG